MPKVIYNSFNTTSWSCLHLPVYVLLLFVNAFEIERERARERSLAVSFMMMLF